LPHLSGGQGHVAVIQSGGRDADIAAVAKSVDPTPWWKPTLDARGRLVTSKRPVRGWRRFAEVTRNALVLGIVLGGVCGAVFGNVVVAGVVVWVVVLAVVAAQLRSSDE
jgi:hypothetical protein